MRQRRLRFLTGISVRKNGTVEGPGFVERLYGDPDRLTELLFAEFLFPCRGPTSNTRSQRVPGTLCRSSVAGLALHVTTANDVGDVAASSVVEKFSGRLSLRGSKTPTTTQALRCFSGLPLYAKFHLPLL